MAIYNKPKHELTIPNKILIAPNLNANEKIVLSEIIWMQDYNTKHNQGYYCYVSNGYLHFLIGVTRRQITKIISDLVEKGYIKILKSQCGDFRHISYNKELCIDGK